MELYTSSARSSTKGSTRSSAGSSTRSFARSSARSFAGGSLRAFLKVLQGALPRLRIQLYTELSAPDLEAAEREAEREAAPPHLKRCSLLVLHSAVYACCEHYNPTRACVTLLSV